MEMIDTAYALDSGKLYIAAGNLPEAELRQDKYLAGETKNGVRVRYTARVKDINNENGDTVARVKYGEKLTVTGELKKIRVSCLAALTGCRSVYDTRSHKLALGAPALSGRRGTVSAMIVCPLPDGTEFCLNVYGSSVAEGDMAISDSRTGGISFSISSLMTDGGTVGSLAVKVV